MEQRKPARQTRAIKSRPKPETGKAGEELIRLNRFIAHSGVCSRREADELIRSGLITVNGKKVTDLGTKVSAGDDIRYKNRRLSTEKKVYILMNKPRGYVTTVEDPHAEQTVIDLIGDACTERVYPVGRLDKETTGVLLLTNDGDLTGSGWHGEGDIWVAKLDFYGNLAFIGLSQVRESATFSGLPLTERLSERVCGLWVYDLQKGQTLGYLKFDSGVEEIFAVQVLPNYRFPEVLTDDPKLLGTSYALSSEALADVSF